MEHSVIATFSSVTEDQVGSHTLTPSHPHTLLAAGGRGAGQTLREGGGGSEELLQSNCVQGRGPQR